MVLVHSHPTSSPNVMDESSFYHSLHELKLQLDRMNQRTATLLRHQKQSDHATSPVTSPKSSSFHSTDFSCPQSHYRPMTDYRPIIDKGYREARIASDVRLKRLLQNEPPTWDSFTPPSSPGSTVHATDVLKPTAEVSEVGYFDPHFDPRISLIEHSLHHLYTCNPMFFVARLRRTSCTKSIPSIDQFLKGSALRWYNIGFRRDGSHWYDIDGQFQLDAFCESLLSVFGYSDDAQDPIIEKGSLRILDAETLSLVEGYAFPALEWAQYQSFPSSRASIERVHDLVLLNAKHDKRPIPESRFECRDVADYLKHLRRYDYASRRTAKVVAEANEEILVGQQQPIELETVRTPAEDIKVTSKVSKEDIHSPAIQAIPDIFPQQNQRQSIFNHEDFIRRISSPSDSASKPQKPDDIASPLSSEPEKPWYEQQNIPIRLWTEEPSGNARLNGEWPYSAPDARRKERRTHSPFSFATREPFVKTFAKEVSHSRHTRHDDRKNRRVNLESESRGGGWYRGRDGRSTRWDGRDESPYARMPHHARSFEDSYSYMRPTHAYAESADSDIY